MQAKIMSPGRVLALALGSLASFASTAALAWGDGAISAWTARNAALVGAVNKDLDAGAPPDAAGKPVLYVVDSRGFFYKPTGEEKAASDASGAYVTNFVAQCKGLTMELIKNGGRNMPVWAQTAQQKFCSGAEALENALVEKPSNKGRCKDLASAIEYAKEAKAGDDPEAILQSASELVAAAEKLRNLPIVMTQKGQLLGDAERTFTCD